MPSPLENVDLTKVADEIYNVLKDSVKDLWKQEDTVFLKQVANDITKQKALAQITASEEHEKNLMHLVAVVHGEAVRKTLRIRRFQKNKFLAILLAVARTAVIPLLKAQLDKK